MIPLPGWHERPVEEMRTRAQALLEHMRNRRTVRDFSDRDVPRDILERCILTAGTAPSGANRQPWRFVVVGDRVIKRRIREEAEKEERAFYGGRASDEWLEALEHLGTDEHKPFLEKAPWLIVVFGESYEQRPDGQKLKNYYVTESVGIATGMLIAALHDAGLATLTHTPSPMRFLNEVLHRPDNERPFLILVVGYPSERATVPKITKKSLEDIAVFFESETSSDDVR
jgi:iodotyrosine deiodinase